MFCVECILFIVLFMRGLSLQKSWLLGFMLLVLGVESDGSVLYSTAQFLWSCLLHSVVICRRCRAETEEPRGMCGPELHLTLQGRDIKSGSVKAQSGLDCYWWLYPQRIVELQITPKLSGFKHNLLWFISLHMSWGLANLGWALLYVSV